MDEDQCGEFAYDVRGCICSSIPSLTPVAQFVFQTRDLEGNYHQDLESTSNEKDPRGRAAIKSASSTPPVDGRMDPEKDNGPLDQRGAASNR